MPRAPEGQEDGSRGAACARRRGGRRPPTDRRETVVLARPLHRATAMEAAEADTGWLAWEPEGRTPEGGHRLALPLPEEPRSPGSRVPG